MTIIAPKLNRKLSRIPTFSSLLDKIVRELFQAASRQPVSGPLPR